MRVRGAVLLIAVASLLAAACGGDGAADTTTTAAEPAAATTEATTTTTEATTTTTEATTTTTEATTTTGTAAVSAELTALRDSMRRTGEATSGRMEGSFELIGVDGLPAESFVMPFSGGFDNATRSFSFVMDMSFMADQLGDEIPPEFASLLGELEVRQIGDIAYIKFPFFSMFLGVETEWISGPADESASATGDLAGVSPGNPSDFLKEFEDANGTVEEIGRETVRGVETTKYRVVFDMQAMLEQATPEERAALEAQGPLPLDELPMEMWVSDDGLVYRYVIEIDGASVETEPGESFESMVMSFEMYDYGETIVIEPPPAAEVTPMDDIEGLFGSRLFTP